MRPLVMIATLLAPALSLAQFTLPDVDSYLSPKVMAKLQKGQIVQFRQKSIVINGNTAGGGFAVGIIDAPPQMIWPHIVDAKRHYEFMPRLIRTKIIEDGKSAMRLRQTIKVFGREISYHLIQTLDHDAHVLEWRIDHSRNNDITETVGSWTIRPYGKDQSLVVYYIMVNTGMRVPNWIENFLTRRDIPNVVKALKRRAESNGEYRK